MGTYTIAQIVPILMQFFGLSALDANRLCNNLQGGGPWNQQQIGAVCLEQGTTVTMQDIVRAFP